MTRDTLGQRVRERFNEEVSYDAVSQTSKKLSIKPNLIGVTGQSQKSRSTGHRSLGNASKITKQSLTSTVVNRVIGLSMQEQAVEVTETPEIKVEEQCE